MGKVDFTGIRAQRCARMGARFCHTEPFSGPRVWMRMNSGKCSTRTMQMPPQLLDAPDNEIAPLRG
jgi:hypothetical protein